MRLSKGLFTAAFLGAATLVVGVAVGQPGRPRRPPPPPPVTADAGQSDPYATPADAGAPATSATAAEVPPPRDVVGDGGVRASPLNPQPNELPDGGPPPAAFDYDRLLADIAALRARVAAVSDTLFQSRIAVAFETSGDHGKIAKLSLSLDDGVVFVAPSTFHADDLQRVYEHAVAPGRHAVTVDVERADDRNPAFRTSQRSRFVVDVPRDHLLSLDVRIWDDSTMGADFPDDKSGRYELRIRARATAKPVRK